MDAAIAWLKALHIASMLFWSASLFYLPGLLAAHPRTKAPADFHRLRLITRMAFIGIASPAAIIAIISGSALIYVAAAHGGWLALKLTAVALMAVFHVYCGTLVARFRYHPARPRPAFLYALTGVPVVLVAIVFYLVLGKPV